MEKYTNIPKIIKKERKILMNEQKNQNLIQGKKEQKKQ